MSFGHPLILVALVAVPVAAGLWLLNDRRRARSASAFTNLALLPNLVDRAPGRLRLVPPALFLVALTALIVGFARPHATITVPRHEATVVLAIDVSRSMQAHDIAPSRMVAAQRAAGALPRRDPVDVLRRGRRLRQPRVRGGAADAGPLARPAGARGPQPG